MHLFDTWVDGFHYAIKMATSNSVATMDKTANRKQGMAKAKDGTAKAKGVTIISKDKADKVAKVKEQAFVWGDNKVELVLKVTHGYKLRKQR